MKYLLFIRGEHSDLRDKTVTAIMRCLNPNINNVRAIKVSMDDYGPFNNKGDRKAAASSTKRLVRKLLSGSHQEEFIVIDNTNTNQTDWTAMFNIAGDTGVTVSGIGIDVRKNEQTPNLGQKNKKAPNACMFKAMMYKYMNIENEQDIDLVIKSLSTLNEV